MKIMALGSTAMDLKFACLATLIKFVQEGHEVHVVIVQANRSNRDLDEYEAKDFFNRLGISNVHFIGAFDYAAITQANASALNLYVKKINPALVIMPFWKSLNQNHRILARSCLIACRGIGNILMYELENNNNPSFTPTMNFIIHANEAKKTKSFARNAGTITDGTTSLMAKGMQLHLHAARIAGNNNNNNNNGDDYDYGSSSFDNGRDAIPLPEIESYESHRTSLLEADWL